MVRKLTIYGGTPLYGKCRVQGSKNAALPILAATLLTDEICEIKNCPDIADVRSALSILKELGAEVTFRENCASICAAKVCGNTVADCLMRKMRSSVLFLGALLSRCGKACISYPGGCALGTRPIDLHLQAMRRLGIVFTEKDGFIHAVRKRWTPQTVTLLFPSVGATENLMLLCAASPGEICIVNPAREPEIVDLQDCLNAMGANISGAGGDVIRICGVKSLHGCTHNVIPDRIAAATYACAVTAAGGEITLTRAEPEHLRLLLSVLEDAGVETKSEADIVQLFMHTRPKPCPVIKTLPYPGFPTDMQPLLMAAMLCADGTTVIGETIFENRMKQVGEFLRMGAEVRVEQQNAVIRGVPELHGAEVRAWDLRGGAALAVAALSARGKTQIDNMEPVERGYEEFAGTLQKLGANAYWNAQE